MKKITIVVQEKDREEALVQLSRLGLVHLEHIRRPAGDSLEEIASRLTEIDKALAVIPESAPDEKQEPVADVAEVIEEIFRLKEELARLKEVYDKRLRLIEEWKIWGDFDVQLLRRLNSKGIWIYLTELPEKELAGLPDDVGVQVFARRGGVAYCGIISDKPKYFYFKTRRLPPQRLAEMIKDQKETESKIAELEDHISALGCYRTGLEEARNLREREREFEQARTGMGETGKLAYLRGYCPLPEIDALEESGRKNRWGLLIEDPNDEDHPPTLITNPRWVKIIEPVFKLIDTIPGYREIDSSLVFLVFFSLFFAMLIGDAGYGAVFLLATGLVQWKFGSRISDKRPLLLFYLLSSATVIWGILTGTFFGQQWLTRLLPWHLDWLRVNNNIIWLCFLIGAIQLSIAHLWRAARKAPSLLALADLGWICVIWTMYFVAGMFILGKNFPAIGFILLTAGMILIIGFSIPPRRFFNNLFVRLITVFLSVINSFADVVSYIRLFAVGLATVAIADFYLASQSAA